MTVIRLIPILILFGCVLLLPACSVFRGPHYAEGSIAGQPIAAELDSSMAKNALSASTQETADAREKRFQLEKLLRAHDDSAAMQILLEQGSPDFASIVFANKLMQQGSNACWQSQSWQLSQNLDQALIKKRVEHVFRSYHLLVVPGWHWQSRPHTGAAMEYPRKVLRSLGLESSLIETDEHGSVETNAKIIVDSIVSAQRLGKPLVLVSASKGGADTVYALGMSNIAEQVPYLKGWLNIGGVIAGSTLVDYALQDAAHWLQWLGLPADTPIDAMLALSTQASLKRFTRLQFSQDIRIVNYSALAFSSSVSERSRESYRYLAQYGPNDGAALVTEMQVSGQPSVLEFDLDHYMRAKRAMYRIIALLLMMMEDPAQCDS